MLRMCCVTSVFPTEKGAACPTPQAANRKAAQQDDFDRDIWQIARMQEHVIRHLIISMFALFSPSFSSLHTGCILCLPIFS